MDLQNAASSATRVLTTRHLIVDKALAELNNGINTTLLCHSYSLRPEFDTYLSALRPYIWILWICGLMAFLTTCFLFVATTRAVLRLWKQDASNAIVVVSVYPIVAGAGFIAILVPRARIIAEAISQEAVMVSMYHLFCMILTECGGMDELIRRAGDSKLETRVLPCCCWPCCLIPKPELDKRNLNWLRYLVLQMPIIQTFIYILMLVLWAEDMNLYLQCFVYFQPFVAVSILSGVWGVIMSIRAAEAAGARLRAKFFALQLVLLIVKLQCGFAKILPEMFDLPCTVSLHPTVVVNMVQNSVMLIEMLLLSLWAWRLYSSPPSKMEQ